MKQILVISGKGGTGKTVVTGSLAALASRKIMVDCDVDAADLHLLLHPQMEQRHEFRSGQTAVIDQKRCTHCGRCGDVCRFAAITSRHVVESFFCEGCGLCAQVCPVQAIQMQENLSGEWFVSRTVYGPLVHAKLGIAEENSGKLVAKIREVAKKIGEEQGYDYVIIDGPPGIGCPVIASLSGVDCALVVTEPTLSGLHDAKRVVEVAGHFGVPVHLVINKYDLNLVMTKQIENFCHENHIPVVGKIPFDRLVVQALIQGKTIVEFSASLLSEELAKIWVSIKNFVASKANV
jgi:MinD superfamily P-loop ATPase